MSVSGHMANPSREGVLIREATAQDAGALLALKGALDRETSFMLLEPDERTTTEAEAADQLRAVASRPNSVVLVGDSGGELVATSRQSVAASGATDTRPTWS